MSGSSAFASVATGVVNVSLDPKLAWYLTRSTGLVLLVLFTFSTALGLLSSVSKAGGRVPRFVATDLHRRMSLMALVLLVVHVAAAIADNFVEITVVDALIPFRNSYRPVFLGLGTFADDLMLVLIVTSLLRHRMDVRAWRSIHLLSYAMWPMVVLHGLGTGFDAKKVPVVAVTAACVLLIVVLTTWRVLLVPTATGLARTAALVGLPVISLALVLWAVAGPLAPGWSKKAGTPPPPPKVSAPSTGVAGGAP